MTTRTQTLSVFLMAVATATLVAGSYLAAGPSSSASAPATATATVAAGCFWCVEADFDKLPGVVKTTSGYTGGARKNPSYEQVSAGGTGHAEAVQIQFDPAKVTYEQVLDYFWRHVDPFSGGGQFCDRGDQYRPAIFTHDAEQQRVAEASKVKIETLFTRKVAVQIVPATTFYAAEEYHQDYYRKNPIQYRAYRMGCGRDGRLDQVWKGIQSH
jgi:peptide-methionine (S)-S-oxide reductase